MVVRACTMAPRVVCRRGGGREVGGRGGRRSTPCRGRAKREKGLDRSLTNQNRKGLSGIQDSRGPLARAYLEETFVTFGCDESRSALPR